MSEMLDRNGNTVTEGSYVYLDDHEAITKVVSIRDDHENDDELGELLVADDENEEPWAGYEMIVVTPHPAEDPTWFRDEHGGRWLAPVGDGTINVTLYDDELATFPPLHPERPLRVEVYTKVVHLGGGPLERRDYRWRVRHSNGEVMASGEGYVDKRDRDHAVKVLHPDLDVIEVEG